MKEVDLFLKAFVDSMKSMAKGMEVLAERLGAIVNSRMDEKPKKKSKSARKAPAKQKKKKPATAAETVLGIINRSRKGVDTKTLMKKTGFNAKKINNNIYKLTKEGKIKSVGRGVYLKA
jgi:hypothetical protein